jgi:glucose-1-phosphate thymidylyltransferase
MRVILPMAGLGKRMRPQTWSKPKPLLQVAGKPMLGHILDKLTPLGVDQVVFVTGWLGDQIRDYVQAHYTFDSRFVVQQELEGQAHAVYLAREYLRGPCLIMYVDTLFEADLTPLATCQADGVIFVKEVEDPRPFGVVVEREGRVVRYIEKPQTLEHRKTTIGVFWVRDGAQLEEAIAHLLANNMRTRGEFYLADAFNVMIDRGAHIISHPVEAWQDCGQPDTLLATNRYLLEHGHTQVTPVQRSVLVPPVHVAATAVIEDAVVGPYVSVGDGVVLRRTTISDSIVESGAVIEGLVLEHSLVGRGAHVRAAPRRLNIGDDDVIVL